MPLNLILLVASRRASRGSLLGQRLAALLVEHFEVDLGQVHRREAGTGDHVGDVATQVRINDVRAADAARAFGGGAKRVGPA